MNLACPSCPNLLHEAYYGAVSGHLCTTGCGGIWIASEAITALTRSPRMVDRMLAATGLVKPLAEPEQRICPSCHEHLDAWIVSGSGEVEIDTCPKCEGIWLDQGEVATLVVLHRKGKHERRRKQPVATATEVGHDGLAVVAHVAEAALYAPDLAIASVELGVEAAGAGAELVGAAIEALPANAEAITIGVVATADVIASNATVIAESVGGVAEVAGDALGGLADLFSLFG